MGIAQDFSGLSNNTQSNILKKNNINLGATPSKPLADRKTPLGLISLLHTTNYPGANESSGLNSSPKYS